MCINQLRYSTQLETNKLWLDSYSSSHTTLPHYITQRTQDRTFNDKEVARLARYQMVTIEKWYTSCGSAGPPHQSGPSCAAEHKAEKLHGRIRAEAKKLKLPRPTAILYWNSMFDFSMYAAHQYMLDLEAAGVHAFLRDISGSVISLCNDGNAYCNITTYDWTQPAVREFWIDTVVNATTNPVEDERIDGIFADHSANEGTRIGVGPNGQGVNQLCNGKGAGRSCYNFTADFAARFNSWHWWVTNYTQDLLSKTTGGPVIQGPLGSMNNATWAPGHITDSMYCDFDSIRRAQSSQMGREGAIFEARGLCGNIKEHCLAAYLAAVEVGTYIHCTYNGDDLLKETVFDEMDNELGPPTGPAVEVGKKGSNVWVRHFKGTSDGRTTVVTYDNNKHTGTVVWPAGRV